MGLFIYALYHGLSHMADNLTQLVVPGTAQLTLQHGKTYTVFLEEESVVNGKVYSTTESVSGLECHVTAASDGAIVPIRKAGTNTTYELNSRSGRSVLEFHIDQDGKYLFACDYVQNSKGPETVVAVGSGVGESIMLAVVECLTSLFGGVAAALAVIALVLIRREREKKKLWLMGQAQRSEKALPNS